MSIKIMNVKPIGCLILMVLAGSISSLNLLKANAEQTPLIISQSYHWDPENEFDGRVGPVIFTNNSSYAVTVKLWHSDNQQVYGTYRVGGGKSLMLISNAGSSWGIQVAQSQVFSLAKIASWNDGKFYVSNDSFF